MTIASYNNTVSIHTIQTAYLGYVVLAVNAFANRAQARERSFLLAVPLLGGQPGLFQISNDSLCNISRIAFSAKFSRPDNIIGKRNFYSALNRKRPILQTRIIVAIA